MPRARFSGRRFIKPRRRNFLEEKMNKEKEDNYYVIAIFALSLMLVAFFIMIISESIDNIKFKKDYECYISHVKECLECHNQNLTYLLCSGFCVNPSKEDYFWTNEDTIDYFCRIGLNKNCWDLPKECNL